LNMSSKEIEDYVMQLKSSRQLTSVEDKELRKQRRLIKNREYASQSRGRKKVYVDELEKKIADISAENSSLKSQVQCLTDENGKLKKHIAGLGASGKQTQTFSNMCSKIASIGNGHSLQAKTASACVLVVFFMAFSFGIYWDKEPAFVATHTMYHFQSRVLLENDKSFALSVVPPSAYPDSTATTTTSTSCSSTETATTTTARPSSATRLKFSNASVNFINLMMGTALYTFAPLGSQSTSNIPPANDSLSINSALQTNPCVQCG